MKQNEDLKRLGYVGSIHHRDTTDDDELKRTYASEFTLSEKYGKTKQRSSAVDKTTKVSATKLKEGKKTASFETNFLIIWSILFIFVILVFFTISRTRRDNIRRLITDCGKPKSILYGSIVVNEEEGTKYGSKASVVCSRGFTSSKPEATCQENGRWSFVYCHVTDCGNALPVIENGQSTINEKQDTTFGATASVTCAQGYQQNKPKIFCQANGMWEDATCQPVDCGILTIKHGYLEKDGTVFMSQATVKCETGYKPSQPKVTCTASGTWQQAECYNVDDCANNPCLNEGKCEDKVADYVCKCKRWYSGKNCEISEACANHKCQCGGTCIPTSNDSYICACPYHIDGNFCESPHIGFKCN